MRIDPRRFFEFLFLMLMAMCLFFIYLRNIGDRRAVQLYNEAGRLAYVMEAVEPSPAPSATTSPAEDAPGAEAKEDTPSGMDLSPLQEVNPDVVGWTAIPGVLSYPLLQGGDNAYYLTHAWNGEENAAGAVFLDCRADACLGDFNTLIYGHRMRNGTMFGSLKHYKDAEKQDFIRCGLERSVIDTGVTPTAEDTVITLSTCSGGDRNTRWVVQAVRSL